MTNPGSLEQLVGTTFADKYRLTSLLGSGGMGYVYQAEQIGLGRSVAVKLLRRDLIETRFEWFRAEAMAASRINHPHAVAIYDFGVTKDGIPYLVMEHLRGLALSDLISEEPLGSQRIVTIAAQILSALAEAHACGVVHCDLTGDNVLVERLREGNDFAKVIDFGLARLFNDPKADRRVAGTVEYMAPEQIRGELINPRTDLYAMGTLLYEMITGRTPFAGSSTATILDAQVNVTPLPPTELAPSCPQALSDIVMHALRKKSDERPSSASEMREAVLAAVSVSAPATASSETRTATLTLGSGPRRIRPTTPPARPAKRPSRISRDFGLLPGRGLIGRDEELSRAIAFIGGRLDSRVLVITGPPGIGKARLVLEAASRGQQRATTFVAAADPCRLQTPWYPVLSVIEAVIGMRAPTSYEDLQRAASAFGLPARDVPGLAEIFALPGPAEVLELTARRREAHAAARRTLIATGRRCPGAVLCFADLDRYDQPSIQLVEALCKDAAHSQIRVVVTSREDPGIAAAERVKLGSLTEEHARTLAEHLAGPGAAVPPAETVFSLTNGSPAAVEQLAGWIEMGNAAADAPTPLVDMVSVRVNRLPAVARRVLQAVAIHGTVAQRWLVEACLGQEEMTALNETSWTGLLEIDGDDVRIPSELVANVITACTPADVRRRLHWRALDALRDSGSIGVLAHHAERAGELGRAFEYSMHAGHDAVRRFDDAGAALWYGRAVGTARELHSRGVPEGPRDMIEASLLLAEVLRLSGEPNLSIGVLDEAELFQPTDLQRARIERQRGLISLLFGDAEPAVHHLQIAIGRAIRGGDGDLLCQAYLDLARALGEQDSDRRATAELEQAIDVITLGQGLGAPGCPAALWRVGLALAERYLAAERLDEARTTAAAALAHARRIGFPHARGRVSALLAHICEAQGDVRGSLGHRANAIEEMRQLGDRRSTAELLIESATASRAVDLPDAVRLAEELATEIDWQEGVSASRQLKLRE